MFFDNQTKVLLGIAAENPDGFTVKIPTMQLVTSGVAVAYKATQNQFSYGGAYYCYEHAIYHDGFVGGWKNQDGRFQFDSVRIFTDLRKAVAWGRKQGQIAIFDLDNGWEIVL